MWRIAETAFQPYRGRRRHRQVPGAFKRPVTEKHRTAKEGKAVREVAARIGDAAESVEPFASDPANFAPRQAVALSHDVTFDHRPRIGEQTLQSPAGEVVFALVNPHETFGQIAKRSGKRKTN